MKNFNVYAIANWWKNLDRYPKLNWQLSIVWLLIISVVAFLWNLGSIGLIDKTEPMFVEAARQMVVTGDWVTPYWNGETRFDKPPLVYWLTAIAFKILGINEWAARLPSALAAIALTVLGFYTLRYFGYSRPKNAIEDGDSQESQTNRQLWISAWIGVAAIALNPAWIAWGRTGVSDMLLASNIAMAMLSFFIGYARRGEGENLNTSASDKWYIAFYVFIALAILAKGPVGLVLPVLGIGAFLLYLGNFKQVLLEMRPVRGCLITGAIAIPWFVLVTLANGQAYIDTFFGYHNIQRFTSVVSSHRGPWYFYFPVVLIGLLPWSIYLPIAIARLRFWQRNKWQQSPRSAQLGLFALFWFISVFLFFSISVTKLPSYVLPLMPAGAILVTLLFGDLMTETMADKPNKKIMGVLISASFNILFLVILSAATFLSTYLIGYDPATPQLREVLQASGLPTLSGIIWGIAAIASIFLLLNKQQWRWLWSTNLAAMMAFIMFVAPPAALLMDAQRQLPLRQLSEIVIQAQKPGEELIAIGFIRPSLTFYTRQTVSYIDTFEEAFAHIKQSTITLPNPNTVLLLGRVKIFNTAVLKSYQYQELGVAGAFKLIRISKFSK